MSVEAWLAQAEGKSERSRALMNQAVEIEYATPKHAVTPGPPVPALELLGDLLLEQERPREALAAFRRSLDLYPRRLNGLLGAARAARASAQIDLARDCYVELLELAGQGSRESVLLEARAFLRGQASSP